MAGINYSIALELRPGFRGIDSNYGKIIIFKKILITIYESKIKR